MFPERAHRPLVLVSDPVIDSSSRVVSPQFLDRRMDNWHKTNRIVPERRYTSSVVTAWIQGGKNLLLRQQTSVLSAAMVIMVAYAASGILGLFRNRLLAEHFFSGQEAHLDAYFAAFVLPDTLFQLLILGGLSAAFIPVFTSYLRKDEKEAWHVASASMTAILLLFLTVSALLFVFAKSASTILAPTFSPELSLLTAQLIRIMLVAQLFFALSSFMTGMIQSHHRFLIPAIAPLFYNMGIILGIIVLSPLIGIYGAAIGVVAGALFHVAVQLPLAMRLGFRFRFSTDFSHPGVRKIWRLMPARAATLAIDQIERIIAVSLSSSLAAGTITLFNFARQLYVLPITLVGATLSQASFPALAHAHENGHKQFMQTVSATLLSIIFLAFPAAALLLVLRIPVVRLAFGAKQFPWEATLLTGKAVAIFALSMSAQTINQFLVRVFYAAQNTKIPLVTAMVSTALVGILAPVFVRIEGWGVLGIVTAIVIADIVDTCLLFLLLERKITHHLTRSLSRGVAKIAAATALMGIFLWIPLRILDQLVFDTTRTIPLIALTGIASVIGVAVYILFSWIFHIEQLSLLKTLLYKVRNIKQILSEAPAEVLEIPTSNQT